MTIQREHEIIAETIKSLIDLVPVFTNLERQLNTNPTNLGFMADTTWVIRKSKEILAATEKRLNDLERKVAAQACICFGLTDEKNYKTDQCTISPNSDLYVKYPARPEEEGYEEFVKQLPLEALRPHYPDVVRLISARVKEGGQLPFGLDRKEIQGVNPKLRVLSKKDL